MGDHSDRGYRFLLLVAICAALICPERTATAQEEKLPPQSEKEIISLPESMRLSFVTLVDRVILALVANEDKQQLRRAEVAYLDSRKDPEWLVLYTSTSTLSAKAAVPCMLTVSTVKDGKPNPLATIKYRRVGSSGTLTMRNPSTSKQRVEAGYYYIWAERNGNSTSDPNDVYDCLSSTAAVTISEQ
jgi:hypothetical protein